jgi:copper chaperone CopZ
MSTLKFKTSINCANCVRAVTPFLDAEPTVQKWNVDTTNPDKILTVEGENVIPEQVMKAVAQAGFDIEPRQAA